MRLIDAALAHQVLNQTPDRVLGQRSYSCRFQTETSFQPARYVVLATAFPGAKTSRRVDTVVAGIKTEHHFAETHQIPAAISFRLDRETHFLKSLAHV